MQPTQQAGEKVETITSPGGMAEFMMSGGDMDKAQTGARVFDVVSAERSEAPTKLLRAGENTVTLTQGAQSAAELSKSADEKVKDAVPANQVPNPEDHQ